MKNLFSFSLMILGLPLWMSAQNVNTAEVTSNSNYTRMSSVYVVGAANENIDDSEDVKGSAYLYPNYKLGSILRNDEVVTQNVAIKYNVYNDLFKGKINMTAPEEQAHQIIKSKEYKIRIGNELFMLGDDNTYYQVLYWGDKGSILKKHSKTYYESVQATTSLTRTSPARYKDKHIYVMIDASGNYKEVPSSKKKFLKLFGAQQDDVKKFVKDNKISLSKDEGLAKVFEYYNSL
ncbi:hypothetical protein POV27_17145 [Aureisphaera galaxeae]|uniref:hypothetical protein n=1 Tax=Aureisphaera galaxeae TaxID=1538023 RepID=UPI002350798C|nr:hypothetical protein [Aureisphaera galaxeae]MDC8005782.1 hypothetical protein [Aureisphaera galaxeae]